MQPRTGASYEFGPFTVDTVKRVILRDAAPVSLTSKAFDTLVVLVQRSGQTVGKDELLRLVWSDSVVEENNLTQSISALRKALGEHPKEHRYIVTVPGQGYRFVAPVREGVIGNVTERDLVRVVPVEPEAPIGERRLKSNGVSDRPAAAPAMIAPRPWSFIALGLVGAAAVGAAVAVYLMVARRPPAGAATTRFEEMTVNRLTTAGTSVAAAVSPDGKYVAHVIGEGGKQGLWIRQVSSALNVPIVPPAAVELWGATFSHDGSTLYYVVWDGAHADAELYEIPALGGTAKRLVTDIDTPVAVSPDGRTLAFVVAQSTRGTSALTLTNTDGTGRRNLAARAQPEYFSMYPRGPTWSPDGSLIALAGGTSAGEARYMNVIGVRVDDGSEQAIGRQQWSEVGRVAWLPDGSGLVLTARDHAGSPRQLWHLSYPSGKARRVTNDANDYGSISLTADGNTLMAIQTMQVSALWVIADEGSGRARQIASEIGNDDGSEGMSWTPDGKILYRSIASGNWDIWSVDPDEGHARQLTVDPATDLHPSASPDGRYVVFASDRSGTFIIWRIERDGRNPMPLTRGTEQFFPQVSPDGRWVIYQRGSKAGEKATLWKVSIDGGEPQLLSDEYLARPAISPDGAWIACYYRKPGKPLRVAILPFTGGKPVNEFSGSPVPRTFRWTPNGRALTYIEDRDGVSNLWMQPLDGGAPRPVTDFTTEQIFDFDWSRDGKRLACSRGAVTNDIVMIRNFR